MKFNIKHASSLLLEQLKKRLEVLEIFKKYPGALNGLHKIGLVDSESLSFFLDQLCVIEDDKAQLKIVDILGNTRIWSSVTKTWEYNLSDEDEGEGDEDCVCEYCGCECNC